MKKIYLFILFYLIIPINILAYSNRVVLGGNNVGIGIESDGILIVGFYKINNTLNNSKLVVGDYITSINGNKVDNINDLIDEIDKNVSDGEVIVGYRRNGENKETTLKLELIDGVYKTGLYVKDSLTGLGTLTYIDPESKIYGALGHEILESSTNSKVEVKTGNIFKSEVTNITKSVNNAPGTKNAKFYRNIIYGDINKNNNAGIYGKYTSDIDNDDLIEIDSLDNVKLGDAYIYTSLEGNKVNSYKINIVKIDKNNDIKNLYFEVDDPVLLDKAGGIVQGMSGSPIVQNNKLIGAVTHVSLDNVETGYGIGIIKMLEKGEE